MSRGLFSSSGASLAEVSRWVVELLSGQVVTALAVIAVALLGYNMLSGRISLTSALRLVLGCFVLLSSATIARGFVDAGQGTLGEPAPPDVLVPAPTPSYSSPNALPHSGRNPFDPYAGSTPPN